MTRLPTTSTLFPYTTLFRSPREAWEFLVWAQSEEAQVLFADTMHGIPNIRKVLKNPRLRQPQNPNELWKRGYAKLDRKSTRLNSSHVRISYAVFCLKKKTTL